MAEKDNERNFHSYLSSSMLFGVAITLSILTIVAAVVIALPMFAMKQTGIGILVIIGGVVIGVLSISWVLVFTNMSDDLKLLGEEMCNLRNQLLRQEQSTLSFYEATNKIMQKQLGELEDIKDQQDEFCKTVCDGLNKKGDNHK